MILVGKFTSSSMLKGKKGKIHMKKSPKVAIDHKKKCPKKIHELKTGDKPP